MRGVRALGVDLGLEGRQENWLTIHLWPSRFWFRPPDGQLLPQVRPVK